MTYYVVVALSGVALASSLILFKGSFFGLVEKTTALLNVMLDGYLSDDDKQSALIKQLVSLLYFLARAILGVVVTALATLAPLYLYALVSGSSFGQLDTRTVYFYLALSVGSVIPFVIYPRIKPSGDYSEWSQLLHRMILNNPNISRSLFHLESRWTRPRQLSDSSQFVVITGLARAGTTALTTLLHNSSRFFSLSYANMPFLLSPNLWGKVYKPGKGNLKERSHGDKVLFGYNTVEALEEHFWKVFTRDSYITPEALLEHEIDDSTYHNYLKYQALIGVYAVQGSVYLCKNNNFMLRYRSIRSLNRDFKIVVMFRDPVSHAASLLNQHKRYQEMQSEDNFVKEYMNWLGHHEFGLGHRPLQFNDKPLPTELEQDTINYWIALWIGYYENILALPEDPQMALVDYQDFLQHPEATLQAMEQKFNISIDIKSIEPFSNPKKSAETEPSLREKADKLYQQLLGRKLKIKHS